MFLRSATIVALARLLAACSRVAAAAAPNPSSSAGFLAVPATVTAGASTTATIAAGSYSVGGDTSRVRALEVFLASGNATDGLRSPNTTESECYLVQALPLCSVPGISVLADHVAFDNVAIPFTVPPSVSGGGSLIYALRLQILQADGTVYGAVSSPLATKGLPPSNAFSLTNTTGRGELFANVFAPAAYVPCAQLACVNGCFGGLFGSTASLANQSASTAQCANAQCGGGIHAPADWLLEDPASIVALSTVSAGAAGTACFAAATATGTGSAATTTAAGSPSRNGAAVRGPLGSWMTPMVCSFCLGLVVVL